MIMRLFIYLLRTEQSLGKVVQMLEKKMKGRVTKLAKVIVTRWKVIEEVKNNFLNQNF